MVEVQRRTASLCEPTQCSHQTWSRVGREHAQIGPLGSGARGISVWEGVCVSRWSVCVTAAPLIPQVDEKTPISQMKLARKWRVLILGFKAGADLEVFIHTLMYESRAP